MRVSLPARAAPPLEMMSSPAQAAEPAEVLLVLTQVPVQCSEAGAQATAQTVLSRLADWAEPAAMKVVEGQVPQAEPVWA